MQKLNKNKVLFLLETNSKFQSSKNTNTLTFYRYSSKVRSVICGIYLYVRYRPTFLWKHV